MAEKTRQRLVRQFRQDADRSGPTVATTLLQKRLNALWLEDRLFFWDELTDAELRAVMARARAKEDT